MAGYMLHQPGRTYVSQYKVLNVEVEVDFGLVYGKEFEFLNDKKPTSVMLAEGSEIAIKHKKVIK